MSQTRLGFRDRRDGRRLVFGRDYYPEVVVSFQGVRVLGVLMDLAEAGVRVGLRVNRELPDIGEPVDLVMATEGAPTVAGLLVRRKGDVRDGLTSVMLFAELPVQRAQLWRLLDSLETERAPGSTTHSAFALSELPKIPGRGDYTEDARVNRLEWLRQQTGATLGPLDATFLAAERLSSNIENMIGAVEVPVGVAGPLHFRGKHARGIFYAPLATTEGALVASCVRGATAITRSGGVTTRVVSQRMTRVPAFNMSSLKAAVTFAHWISDHVHRLREQVHRVSRHAELVAVEPTILGSMVHVAFRYETGDAAGQNMTTACTWQACQWLLEQMKLFDDVHVEDFIIEANMSGDKKVNYQSFTGGRGIRVVAESHLKTDVLREVLKVTPEQLVRSNANIMAGSIQSGMIGYNINVANIIAAMFTATGQDIACVHECSLAQLSIEPVADGIHASIVLPALILGTVGGGTHLPAQKALLEMMGCAGTGHVFKLAEIIAGFCLSLDLSTLSAVASGQFASAHERLGRNRPVEFFTAKDLTAAFFTPFVRQAAHDQELQVEAVEPVEVTLGSSIVTELTGRSVSKAVGFLSYRLQSRDGLGQRRVDDVLVKLKPLDEEVMLMVNRLAAMCGPRVANAHAKAKQRTGFRACHLRELAVYEQNDARFTRHAPRVYGTYRSERREAYVIVLERLEHVTHLDSADRPKDWRRADIEAAITGISDVHGIWYEREAELLQKSWIGEPHTSESMWDLRDLWDSLATHASTEFPELITPARLEQVRQYARSVRDWWPELEAMPRTLIHGDFNLRNVCLRPTAEGPRLCAYDWELATLHVPQRDIAELFAFVLSPEVGLGEVRELLGFARTALEEVTGKAIEHRLYERGFVLSLRDFAANRLMLYLMAHTLKHYDFLPRVTETVFRLLRLLDDEELPPLSSLTSGAWRTYPPSSRT